jgi:D-glycero-D-manno-heptose 1,7-bisphosphate phosphatase
VADFERLTRWMVDAFGERSVAIDRVYHCPYHPTAGVGAYRRDSFDRKPNPGMLLRARDELGLDLSRSAFVGDQDTDMEAGRRAGVGTLIRLVHAEPPPTGDVAPDVHPIDSLAAAAPLLEDRASGEAPISRRR